MRPLAPPGSELKSAETIGIGDLGDMIGNLEPVANQVLQNLNQRLIELQVTTARVNDLLNDKNRASMNASLGNLNSMLSDSRPKVSASLTNVQNCYRPDPAHAGQPQNNDESGECCPVAHRFDCG